MGHLEDHTAYYSKDNKQRSDCTVFKVIKDKAKTIFGYTVINDRIKSVRFFRQPVDVTGWACLYSNHYCKRRS